MQKLIQQILEQIPIADIFQKYNHFRQQGKNYICCCPFHSEKTPSCVIYPDLYLFYCPNCGVGGDVITYLQITENLSYTDAVNTLAQRLNLNISSKTNVPESKLQRERCYNINREAAYFYYLILFSIQQYALLTAYSQHQKPLHIHPIPVCF
ncbi:MAG: hypothetical protein K2O52_07280 [Oscillospiraceae bacterium]|nr:hypothetical protein [Oscillospiraceae bacterium]